MEIKYIKMPISIEEKKEYHRQGFRVVDEKFKPADMVEEQQEDAPRRNRRRNTAEDEE